MSKKRSVTILIIFLCTLLCFVLFLKFTDKDENGRFEEYTAQLFTEEVSSNTISLHYTLKNPDAYGIHDMPVSLGRFFTDADTMCASYENALALLHSYDRKKLSEKNRLTYDTLEHSLELSLKEASYTLYEEPLAPLTGTQSQLPVLLSEYRFYSTEDCDTYLELLAEIPEYFRSMIEFERAKSDAGLFMASYNADALIQECKTFVQMGDTNYLYSSFEERLKELELSSQEREHYMKKNKSHIEKYVFPAYLELINALNELRTTGKNSCGLCHLPDGSKYYELSVKAQTGSSRSIPELQALTLSQMAEDSKALHEALSSAMKDSSVGTDASSNRSDLAAGLDSDPERILKGLKSDISGLFPDPPNVNTSIKYVQKEMEEYLSPAFYMIPAIDDTKNNVIYINEGHMPDNLTLFTTLAHEGYPGHLYQTVYYSSTNPDPLRSLLGFGGYTEGWATYCEMLSYYFSGLPKEQASMMQHNSSIILGLYALADMGIHYDGWTLLDTVAFFRDYGITDTDTIESIYNLIIGDPGNYLKYYIGYVEFLELKKDAVEKWGEEFSQERFHKEILEIGPSSFTTLRKYMLGT